MPGHEPPILEHLFLESPGPLVALFGCVGLALLIMGNRRADPKLLRIGLGGVLMAAGLWLVAHFVVTDREAITEATQAILDAVEAGDIAAVSARGGDRAQLLGPAGEVWRDREEMPDALRRAVDRYNVSSITVKRIDVWVDAKDVGHSQLDLRTGVGAGSFSGPVQTRWQLDWQRDEALGWRLDRVHWMEHDSAAPNVAQPQRGRWR